MVVLEMASIQSETRPPPLASSYDHRLTPYCVFGARCWIRMSMPEPNTLRRLHVVGAAGAPASRSPGAGSWRGASAALDDAKIIGLLHEDDTHVALHRP